MEFRRQIFLLFSLCLLQMIRLCRCQTKSDYINVMTEIFTTNGYNKKILPAPDVYTPVEIDLSFIFLGINEIDEVAEKMTTTGYLYISWLDEGLMWDTTAHNDLERIFVPQDDIWKPDIFLQNGFKKFAELGGSYYYIEVYYDGWTVWMPFEVFESRCSFDTSFYPFDKQSCNITFVVWSHSVLEVEILKSRDGIILDEGFQENSVWTILSVAYDVSKETRESSITFTFNLERKPLYYIVNILLPVVFLGLLNGLVFVIPAETGEKTGYSVTVFLSLAVFLTIISTVLPVNSEKVSVLGLYLLLQIVIGVIVLIVSTLQLRLNVRSPSIPVTGIYLKMIRLRRRGCCYCCRLCCRRKKRANKVTVLPAGKDVNQVKVPPTGKEVNQVKVFHTGKEMNHVTVFPAGKELIPPEKIPIDPDEDEYSWSDVVSALDFIGFWCFLVVYISVTIVLFAILNLM